MGFGDGGIGAFEYAIGFRFEVAMKFPKISSHMGIVGIDGILILEEVVALDLLVHLEAAGESMPLINQSVPKKIILSLCLDPKEVRLSTISSSSGESKLRGIGPIILFLGRQPVTISASRE